jgi:hypothetical protein
MSNIENILKAWEEYKSIRPFKGASETFDDLFRFQYENTDDCLAGIMMSIQQTPDDPFLRYYDSCTEGSKKLIQTLGSYTVKNPKDEEPKQSLLKKLEMMSRILSQLNEQYKIKQ